MRLARILSQQPLQTLQAAQRSLSIALVGYPNAGKSTLLNSLMGVQLAAVTARPQTTRSHIRAILTTPPHQLVFIDTPGVLSVRESRHYDVPRAVRHGARTAIFEADLVATIVDVAALERNWEFKDERVRLWATPLRILDKTSEIDLYTKHNVLLLNKTDLVQDRAFLREREEEAKSLRLPSDCLRFSRVFSVVASAPSSLVPFQDYLFQHTVTRPWMHDAKSIVEGDVNVMVEEAVREQLLLLTRQEVPYFSHVHVTDTEDVDDNGLRIRVQIDAPTRGSLSIIIGKGGSVLRRLCQTAEARLAQLLQRPVQLIVNVKVVQ